MKVRVRSLARMVALTLAGFAFAALALQPASTAPPAAKAWGAGSTTAVDDFTSGSFTNLLSRNVNPPAAGGALVITGTVSLWEDCSIAGIAHLDVRLRVKNQNVWTGNAFEASPNVECTSILDLPYKNATVTVNAVVPVSGARATVRLQGREDGTGSYIIGRSLSILWVEAGTGPVPFSTSVARQGRQG